MKAIQDGVDPDPFGVGEPGHAEQDDDELINENDDEFIESNVCESNILSPSIISRYSLVARKKVTVT